MPASPSPFDPLLDVLACPACHGALQMQPELVLCAQCGRRYPVAQGIPVLIADRATRKDEE